MSEREIPECASQLEPGYARVVTKELLPIEAARDQVLAAPQPVGTTKLPLGEASGRVLAANIQSPVDVPPFDKEPLSLESIASRVSDRAAGATVIFQGTTREVTRLEYEAYVEMAEDQMRSVLEAVAAKRGLCLIAAEHRIGTVPLGGASVVVAASAPHRAEAFDAAREAIDSIKDQVPIWKKEVVERGSLRRTRWVGQEAPPDSVPKGSNG